MKKNLKKVLLLVLCAALLVSVTVAGTVAYLTSTAKVENTFTVGQVKITMDEALVNEYGQPINNTTDKTAVDVANAPRVAGNTYKLIPGFTYTKDPIIHVDASSEECYLFVKITKGANFTIGEMNGWTRIENTDVWYYNSIAKAGDNVAVFKTITYAADEVNGETTPTESAFVIEAYAVQKATFSGATAAWEATFGKPATNP